jgi:hypothetical protein
MLTSSMVFGELFKSVIAVKSILLGAGLTPICYSRVHKLHSAELLTVAQRYYIFTSLI